MPHSPQVCPRLVVVPVGAQDGALEDPGGQFPLQQPQSLRGYFDAGGAQGGQSLDHLDLLRAALLRSGVRALLVWGQRERVRGGGPLGIRVGYPALADHGTGLRVEVVLEDLRLAVAAEVSLARGHSSPNPGGGVR